MIILLEFQWIKYFICCMMFIYLVLCPPPPPPNPTHDSQFRAGRVAKREEASYKHCLVIPPPFVSSHCTLFHPLATQIAFIYYNTCYPSLFWSMEHKAIVLTLSSLQTNTDTFANSAYPEPSHQDLHCNSVLDFWLKPLFATMDVSKIRDGRVHVRNPGVKGLRHF